MSLEGCNSLFEIFATFNFAHAFFRSDSGYADVISRESLLDFKKFKENLDKLHSETLLVEESLNQIKKPTFNHGVIEGKYTSLKETFVKDYSDITSSISEVSQDVNAEFPYLSFCSGLYSLSVLFLSASEIEYKYTTLFILSILTVTCLVPFIRTKNNTVTHNSIAFRFSYILLLSFAVHLLMSFYKPTFKPFSFSEQEFNLIKIGIILFAMYVSSGHFIVYFRYFKIATDKIRSNYEVFIPKWEKQLSSLRKDIISLKTPPISISKTPPTRKKK